MMILLLLICLKSQSSSIKTPVKTLHKVLHISTTIVVTGVVIHRRYLLSTMYFTEEFPQTLLSFHLTCYSGDENSFPYDSTSNFFNDSPNVFNPPFQPPMYSYEFYGNDAHFSHDCPLQGPHETLQCQQAIFYDPCCENCGGFIKSSVENLIPNPSESEGEREGDVPVCDDFTTFSNILFDAEDDFSSSDNESFSDEEIPKEIYSNPLFDEEIIYIKIDPRHFSVESYLIESLFNQDSLIISSSKIDSLFDEFTGELILLKSIPPRIDEADCDPEEEIRLIKKLLYDNSSPRPLEEFISKNSDAMPPDTENDDYDSKGDILILEEFLSNDYPSPPENESFHFDISSPPAKPPNNDDIEPNLGNLTVKMVGVISKHYVLMSRLLPTQPTLATNQEKSPHLLSHRGLKAFQLSFECPMMIYGGNIPILDVSFLHFYPLDQLKYGGIRLS
nr:hypothetical protein [Tanacetum cinerariifolium]